MSGELPTALAHSGSGSTVLTILDGTIFYGSVVLIALTALPYGTVHPWSIAAFECSVFLLSFLWVIHGLWAGSWGLRNVKLFYPVLALVALAVLQSVTLWQTESQGLKVAYTLSADPFESWLFAIRTAALILAGVLLVRFTSSKRRLSVLVHAIIGVALACAIFGIVRQTLQRNDAFVLPLLYPWSGYAQFINKNHFSYLMELAMGLVVGVAIMRSERRERIPLYFSFLLVMAAALVLSKSRGGYLAMTMQFLCAALLFVNSRRSARAHQAGFVTRWIRSIAAQVILVVVLLSVIVAGAAWLGGDQLATGLQTATSEMSSAQQTGGEGARRRDIWRASWLMFKAHPLTGAGLGGYWAEVPAFHDASGTVTPRQAHNDYLELLASAGIPGVALLVWFAFVLIRQARENVRSSKGFQRAASLGAIIGLVGVGVHSTVDFGLHITINALVLVALLAVLSLGSFHGEDSHRRREAGGPLKG